MDEHRENELRSIYSSWSTVQLVRAFIREKADYPPRALALMSDELRARNLDPENHVHLETLLPPRRPERDTLLFPRRLNRVQYLVRWLIWLAIMVLGQGFRDFVAIPLLLLGLVYHVIAMDIPRTRSAGLSPWILGLLFVPLVNAVLWLALFFLPPKETPKGTPA